MFVARRLLPFIAFITLFGAACGSDDDTGDTEATSETSAGTEAAPETSAAGGADTTAPAAPGGAESGGMLELVALNDLGTLDNSQAVSTIDYTMTAGALYEGLYHFTSEGELEAGLAADLPEVSDDGLTYTITLREGAMFAGVDFEPRAVTAEDAAYAMTRALDPNAVPGPSWGSGYLFPIAGAAAFNAGEADAVSGIEVVDDATLRITLEAPTTSFVYGLTIATSWPVPQEVVEERGEDFGNRPVGAGPFYVQEWNKGQDITLARNPGYVNPDLPYLDGMHVALGVDENTQVLRLQSGEADTVFEQFVLTPPSLQQLAEDPNITLEPSVGPRIYYLALNADGVLGSAELRQAVAHAMSREFTAQFGDLAKPWNQLMSSTSRQSDPEGTRIYENDPEAAAALVTEGGYDGSPIRIVYDVTDPYTSAISTSLAQDLEAVGFTVELLGQQQSEFFETIYLPDAFDISPTYWSADYPDAQDFISTNFICSMIDVLNISRFCDESIDEAFFATEAMPFGAERDVALLEVQQMLIDAVAGVPVMEVTPQVLWGPRVGAIVSLATYAPFDWKLAWLKGGGAAD